MSNEAFKMRRYITEKKELGQHSGRVLSGHFPSDDFGSKKIYINICKTISNKVTRIFF